MLAKVVALIGALIFFTACEAENRPTPFDSVPLDVSHPSAPKGGDSNPEFVEFQLEIFENLGEWPPNYFQATERVLRNRGMVAEADAVHIVAKLRKDTLNEVCRFRVGDLPPSERYVSLLENMVVWNRGDRELSFLNDAVELAEELDSSHRWQFRPQRGWCSAFSVFPGSSTTVSLEDPDGFWEIHDQNRKRLRDALKIVSRAARMGLENNQTPFAFGRPLEFGNAETGSFLKFFKPMVVIQQIPDMNYGQSIFALEQGGNSAIVKTPDFYRELARVYLHDSSVDILDWPEGFVPNHFSRELSFAKASVASCAENNDRCDQAELAVVVSSENGERSVDSGLPVLFENGRPEILRARIEALSKDHSHAFVSLSGGYGTRGPSPIDGSPIIFASADEAYSEYFLIDLTKGIISLRLGPPRRGTFYEAGFRTNEHGELGFLLSSVKSDDSEHWFIIEEFELNGRKVDEITIDKDIKGGRLPPGFMRNLTEGRDISELVVKCGRCEVIGLTPDQKYWIVFRRNRSFKAIELWNAETLLMTAKFEPYWGRVDLNSYDPESGRLVVDSGPQAQVYQYAVP